MSKQSKLRTGLIFIQLGLILLIGVILYLQNRDIALKKPPRYDYETVIKQMEQSYQKTIDELRIELREYAKTKPSEIRYYPVLKEKDSDRYEIINLNDSVLKLAADNRDTIYIEKDFIQQFPNASKLLSFDLTKDKLNLVTLNPQGETKGEDFPLYLDSFAYYWADGQLYRDEISYRKRGDWGNIWMNFGYEYLQEQSFNVDLEYNKDFGRLRFTSTIGFQSYYNDLPDIPNQVLPFGEIKLGYRLFDKNF